MKAIARSGGSSAASSPAGSELAVHHLASYRRAALVALVVLAAGAGCAFTSKGEPLTPRYFSPVPAAVPSTGDAAAPEGARDASANDGASASDSVGAPLDLRIGRIEPAAYLEERISYRVDDAELAYYDDRRWTEPPEQLVRRALESQLFETQTFRRVVSGAAPTLDVEVASFEEVRGETPRARLSLLVTLRDDRHALLERTVSREAPLAAGADVDPGRALAKAMADALGRATREVARSVALELRRQPSSPAQAGAEEGAEDGTTSTARICQTPPCR